MSFAAVMALAGAAYASPLPVQVTFVGAAGGVLDNYGHYVTPYEVSIDDGSGPVLQLVTCYDTIDDVGVGQTWQAYEYTLADAVSGGMFSGYANPQLGYESIGWLSAQTYSNTDEEVALQYAIWNVFGTIQPLAGAQLTAFNNYEAGLAVELALATPFSDFDFSNTKYLEQVGGVVGATGTHQAFVFAITPGGGHQFSTPEPGTIVMIGSGLLCLLTSLGFKRAAKRG